MTNARLALVLLLSLGVSALGASLAAQPPGNDLDKDPLPPGAVARLGTTRLRHGGAVTALSFSGDGKLLASWGQDATARFWDAATGKELRHRTADPASICAVALAPGPTPLAAVADGRTIRIRDAGKGKELRRFEGHTDLLVNVFLASGGRWLVSVAIGTDRTVRLWDVTSGREVGKFPAHVNGVRTVALSADGGILAYAAGEEEVWVWDVAARKQLCRVPAAAYLGKAVQYRLTTIALSADGKVLASGCEDHTTKLWEASTGKELAQLPGGGLSVAFAPDGRTLAAGGWDGAIILWDLATRKQQRKLPAAHLGFVQSLAFSPNGRVLASGGGADGSERVHRLLYQVDSCIRLWDTASGQELPQSRGPRGAVVAASFSPDGNLVASAGRDGTLRLWQASTGRELRGWQGHEGAAYAVAFTPDGKLLASAGQDKAVRLWTVPGGERLRTLRGHQAAVRAVAFSPDSKTLASAGGYDNTARLWDVATGKELLRLEDQQGGVHAVAIAPDGRTVASGGGPEAILAASESSNAIHLWDALTGREVRRLAGPSSDYAVQTLAFAPDGRTLASGYRRGPVRLWELATGGQRLQIESWADAGLAFAPSEEVLATATPNFDRKVHLWATTTGQKVGEFRGHLGGINSLAFAPDGKRLASASDDTTVLLWAVAGRRRPQAAEPDVRAEQLERLWKQLGDGDARRGYSAVTALASAPRQAVALLRGQLRPVEVKPDGRPIARLVADLDSGRFAARQKAMQELEALAELAETALRQARAGGKLSLEAQRRVDQLLEKLSRPLPAGERLRTTRAIEVLERIGTPEARQFLEGLASGAPEAPLTREARAALGRLRGK